MSQPFPHQGDASAHLLLLAMPCLLSAISSSALSEMDGNFTPNLNNPLKRAPEGQSSARGSFGSAFVSSLLGRHQRERHGMSKNRHQHIPTGKHNSKQLKAVDSLRERVHAAEASGQHLHCQRGREGSLARFSAIWLALELPRMRGGTCPHCAAGLSTQNSLGLEMI